MLKKLLALCCAVAIMLTLGACSKEDKPAASGSGETKEITLNAKNFEFDLKEIKVKQGDTLKVTLKNTEGMHGVKFEGYNKEVQADKTVSFVANKKGEFQYVCSIFCGTDHAKMTGKLIVE